MMYDGGFAAFDGIFTIMFLLVIGVFVVGIVRGIGTWNNNNHSPQLVVDAEVVTKRTEVHRHQHGNGGDMTGASGFHSTTSTQYYVTFQVESGDRMEFSVKGSEYGMLAEGDCGKLSFQGTRYIGFQRS